MFSLKFTFSPGSMPPDPYFIMHKKAILPHLNTKKKIERIVAKKIINDIHIHNKKMECVLPLTALKLSPLNYFSSFILLLQVTFA